MAFDNSNDKNDLKLSVKIVYDKDVAKEKYPNASEEELKIWSKSLMLDLL